MFAPRLPAGRDSTIDMVARPACCCSGRVPRSESRAPTRSIWRKCSEPAGTTPAHRSWVALKHGVHALHAALRASLCPLGRVRPGGRCCNAPTNQRAKESCCPAACRPSGGRVTFVCCGRTLMNVAFQAIKPVPQAVGVRGKGICDLALACGSVCSRRTSRIAARSVGGFTRSRRARPAVLGAIRSRLTRPRAPAPAAQTR